MLESWFVDKMDSWSALPPDLLVSIAERLKSRSHIINFRAVCQSWRSAVSTSLLTPTDILSSLFPYKGIIFNNNPSSILVASSVFLLQSSVNPKFEPWLVTVEEFNPGKLLIRAPLSRAVYRGLSSNTNLDLSNINVLELGRFYTFRRIDKVEEMLYEKRLSEYDNKVVLFVNPNCEMNNPTIDDCSLIELYDQVDHLSVTRLKNGYKHQVSFKGREFDDVVNFNGRIYAVDFLGRLCYMEYDSPEMLSVTESPLPGCSRSNYKKRLAVLDEKLYVVYRRCQISDNEGGAFKVFKLNEAEEKCWDELDGVGDDKILFVTFDGCFFVSVKDIPGWKGNCIVFRRGSFPEYSGIRSFDCKIFESWHLHHDVAVFYFQNGDCKPLVTCSGYSGIFTPPSWIFYERIKTNSPTR